MPRILFVEDEQEVLGPLTRFFQQQGFDAYGARGLTEALNTARQFPPDMCVVDVMLNEGS